MNRYFLDTSVIVPYLRNNQETIEMINALDGKIVSSYICMAELFEGVYRMREAVVLEKALVEFFKSLDKVLGLDTEIAKTFGILRVKLKKSGEIIEDMDILIAATCLANDLTLVTLNNKHFSRIVGLRLLSPKTFLAVEHILATRQPQKHINYKELINHGRKH